MKSKALIFLSSFLGLIANAQEVSSVAPPLDYSNETEAGAALLLLDLYNEGVVGKSSGICLDLEYDANGNPQFKAAFDTSAFKTGDAKTGEDPTKEVLSESVSTNFKKLTDALIKMQNGKVNATVDGYADGQHYKREWYPDDETSSKLNNGLNQSIEENRSLAKSRADLIASQFFGKNSNVNYTTNGHPSEVLERKYPGKYKGLKCDTRRKVVVTFDQPSSQIESDMKGNLFRAPEAMDMKVKSKIQNSFKKEITLFQAKVFPEDRTKSGVEKHRTNLLTGRAPRSDVEKVYQSMKGVLNPKCDLPPFKQMTLAMIESTMIKASKEKTENLIEKYMSESGFAIKDIKGGRSALQEGCWMPPSDISKTIDQNGQDKVDPNFAVSGSKYMQSAGLKTMNGKVKVGFDVQSLQPQKPLVGDHKGEMVRGFYCKACGNGLFFNEDPKQKGKFIPEYVDRIVQFKKGDQTQEKFIKNLNEFSAEDPFSVASFVKPRMYVVKNCKNCSCNSKDEIRKKQNPNVLTFDPLAGKDGMVEMSAEEFDNVCIVRPPVHHACNVSPTKNKGSDKESFSQKLIYKSALNDLQITGPDINSLVNNVSNSCKNPSINSKKLTANQKISESMCKTDPSRKLPSEDELADCAREIENRQKQP